MTRWLLAVARWRWAQLVWVVRTVGYWIRPYDMLADRRRWWWQPRQRRGWSMRIDHLRGGEEVTE